MSGQRQRCALALLILAGCASTPEPTKTEELTPARLFPLAPGSAWSYDVDTGDGNNALAITRVTENRGGIAAVQGGEGVTQYEQRPDGIFRTSLAGYLIKAPLRTGSSWPSGGGMQAEIARMGVAIDTPAGHFDGCVEVVERGAPSGALITTTYCPDVGPVLVVSSLELMTGGVQVVARLRGYQIGPAANAAASPGAAGTK
jgi:hypothetical protein